MSSFGFLVGFLLLGQFCLSFACGSFWPVFYLVSFQLLLVGILEVQVPSPLAQVFVLFSVVLIIRLQLLLAL